MVAACLGTFMSRETSEQPIERESTPLAEQHLVDGPTERAKEMAGTYQVAAPERFNFSHPEEWQKWIRRFERFRKASGLNAKDEEAQVNTLVYSMGDDADDILRSFRLSEDDSKKYNVVKSKFDRHFVKDRNTICERARFNLKKRKKVNL